ncbi:MAG TPA: Ku protein [Bryobacteraceae bacterium]|jgi:DNA end-binding protein Ku|nr:Ku protein [Bryobacteraceae bacterium]
MATSVWKGHLTFGLVSLPVRLFTAARSESLSFNQLHKSDHSRIKQVIYCQTEDKPIPRDEIVKGYEYEKGKYVVVQDEEIKKVAPKTAKVMEIQEFVKSDDVDPVYLESSYYMAPDDGGEKPYALLFEALKQTKYYAIARIAMHNREHVVVVRPGEKGMVLHTMYYSDEVRRNEEFRTDTSKVSEKEMNLAKMLVESLAAEFEPEKYHDTYRDNLRKMIEAKVEGHKVVETPEPHVAPVIDIMEALKKSLEARKPPTTATTAAGSEEEEAAEAVAEQPKRKRAARKVKTA